MVGLSVWLPQIMLNPGQLSQGHQEIQEQCTSCHQLFSGIDDARCISCHRLEDIDKDAAGSQKSKLQFHTSLKGQACVPFHTDHKGIDPALSTYTFNHGLLPLILLDQCNTCHATPKDSLHALVSVPCGNCHHTSQWEFSGAFDHSLVTAIHRNNCSSCHQKPADALHEAVKNQCGNCHSTTEWSPATFDHADYFVLDSDHNAKCMTCHTSASDFKIYSCYGCHEHTKSNIAEEHYEESIYQFKDCASCHRSADKHDIRSPGRNNNGHDVESIRKYVEDGEKKDRKDRDDD